MPIVELAWITLQQVTEDMIKFDALPAPRPLPY